MKDYIKRLRILFKRSLNLFDLGNHKTNEILNLDKKKPSSLRKQRAFSCHKGNATMGSIIQSTTQNQAYDASDVAQGFALAYEQVSDLAAMMAAVQCEHEKMIEYLQKIYAIPEISF